MHNHGAGRNELKDQNDDRIGEEPAREGVANAHVEVERPGCQEKQVDDAAGNGPGSFLAPGIVLARGRRG